MSSPDFREYIDLTVFDTTPQKLYDEAVTYAQTAMPEFEPRIGTVEDAILQSAAYVGGILATGINRLPDGIMEGMCRLLGFERNEATFATGVVEFTVSVNSGVVIPAGTVVTYDVYANGVTTPYPFATDTDLVIGSGSDTGTVAVTATYAGKFPALLAGQSLTLVSQVPYILTASLDEDLVVGSNAETQTEFFNRATQYFASLNTTLATKSQMSNYIVANYPTVPVFKVYDLTDSSDMLFATADTTGKVTVSVCDANGDALSTDVKTTLEDDLVERCVAGLTIDVIDMNQFAMDIAIGIYVLDGFAPATVSADVATVLDSYLTHTGWDWQQTVNKNVLIAKASQVSGVKYVSSLTMTLSGSTPYAELETIATVPTGNITILEKGAVPVGTADVSVL